jgi:hypothetical protein
MPQSDLARCRPELNLPKGVFFIRLRPSGPWDQMLSQKFLVDVGIDTFASKNRYQRRKSAAHSTCIASFRPLAFMSGLGHHL